jgi:transcriptional regulator with XRE-family HTH domain
MPRKSPDPVDILVGNNLRILRLRRGMSQTQLGKRLDVTFQQVQKYEKGANRIGAGRLFRAAAILRVPISVLFDGAPKSPESERFVAPPALMSRPDAIRMMEAFGKIGNADSCRLLVRLAEKLALPGKG